MKILWHVKENGTAGTTLKDKGAPEQGNMALHVCLDPEAVKENRKEFEKETLPLEDWALPWQKHTDHIHKATKDDRGRGAVDVNTSFLETDAVYTKESNILVGVFTADCVGIALTGPGAAAAIHSGWKGTAQAIAWKTIKAMKEDGIDVSKLSAWFSPSLMQDSLEVGMEVIEQMEPLKEIGIDLEDFYYMKGDKAYLDNQGLCARMLELQGIPKENIHLSDIDTKTDERGFSYRKDGKGHGEHFTFAWKS